MSCYLQEAVNRVKSGQSNENCNQIQALSDYENALVLFANAITEKEVMKQEMISEVEEEIHFYTKKIHEIRQKINEVKNPPLKKELKCEDDDLVNRIKQSIVQEKPNVTFEDVHGLSEVKTMLEQAVILPILQPQIFQSSETTYKGFLLYGPPGTGKSHIAKAVAGETKESTFFSISASDLVSKYQGESETLIKTLFSVAREMKPSIIFIDEVDSLAQSRSDEESSSTRRIKTELFVQMEGVNSNNDGVFCFAATNTPHNLDDAFLRRFDKLVYIPLPEVDARISMLTSGFKDCPISPKVIKSMAHKVEGLSGSEITSIVKNSKRESIERVQKSQYFRAFRQKGEIYYEPCEKTEQFARRMSIRDIPRGALKFTVTATEDDAWKCVTAARSCLDQDQIRKLEKFAKERGGGSSSSDPVQYKYRPSSKTEGILSFFLIFF